MPTPSDPPAGVAYYLLYRDADISAMSLARVRAVGEVFDIPAAETMSKSELREAIPDPTQGTTPPCGTR